MNLDLGYTIEQEDLAGNDLLIVAGDNLFEFRLADFVTFYNVHRRPIAAFCDLKDVNKVIPSRLPQEQERPRRSRAFYRVVVPPGKGAKLL